MRRDGQRANRTEQDGLEGREVRRVHLGRVDHQQRRRVEARDVDRGGRELPRERDRLGRVVDRGVGLLRRRRDGPVHEMDLVAGRGTLDVVADTSAVGQTERLTGLLADENAVRLLRTVAGSELLRVRERLDRTTELLNGDQVQVDQVVRVLLVRLSPRGRLSHGGEAIPGHTRRVLTIRIANVEHAVVDTGLEEPLADRIPGKGSHAIPSFRSRG